MAENFYIADSFCMRYRWRKLATGHLLPSALFETRNSCRAFNMQNLKHLPSLPSALLTAFGTKKTKPETFLKRNPYWSC